MSDDRQTPRTDAAMIAWHDHHIGALTDKVPADFARAMEREADALRELVEFTYCEPCCLNTPDQPRSVKTCNFNRTGRPCGDWTNSATKARLDEIGGAK